MAEWIKANGAPETVTPKNGRAFTLEELQGFVGGYIEALRLDDGRTMWLNEEGKLNGLPLNLEATTFAFALNSGIASDDFIVGDVVIATAAESGDGEEDDDE